MAMFGSGDYKRFIQGQLTANGTATVTFTFPVLEQNSHVILSLNTVSGTLGVMQQITKVPSNAQTGTPGSISWTGTAGNTSLYDVFLFV